MATLLEQADNMAESVDRPVWDGCVRPRLVCGGRVHPRLMCGGREHLSDDTATIIGVEDPEFDLPRDEMAVTLRKSSSGITDRTASPSRKGSPDGCSMRDSGFTDRSDNMADNVSSCSFGDRCSVEVPHTFSQYDFNRHRTSESPVLYNRTGDSEGLCRLKSMSVLVQPELSHIPRLTRSRSTPCLVRSGCPFALRRSRSESDLACPDTQSVLQNRWTQSKIGVKCGLSLRHIELDPYQESPQKVFKIKNASSDIYIKADFTSNPGRLVPDVYRKKEKSKYRFRVITRTGIDFDAKRVYTLYVFSVKLGGDVFYLHTEDDETSRDVKKLRLRTASRDLFTRPYIPEEAKKFFFSEESQSKLVLESCEFQGYYISFEESEIIVRKTEHCEPNNYIDLFPPGVGCFGFFRLHHTRGSQ